MKILVTGGAGFIGSACTVALLRRGEACALIDNFESTLYDRSRKEENLRWVREHGDVDLHEIDIRDTAALREVYAREEPHLVLHLAAVAGVRPSIQKPSLYYDINVVGTSNLLEIGRQVGVEKFVLASSSSVYGGNEKTPFAEEDPVDSPISPYAASKLAMEIQAKTFHHLHQLDITCLRFFTVYGPRQRPEMAIHKFMRLMADQETIPMYGDGTSGRDYTYIDDIVQGVLAAIDRIAGYRVYNLGGDDVVLLRDLIDCVAEVTGCDADIDQLPTQPGDMPVTNADLTRSRKELDFDPQTPIRDGIDEMWTWFRERRADG